MGKQEKQKLFSDIVAFLKSKGAKKVAVFGSYVRDEETPKSDIDVLTEFPDDMSLMKFVRIQRELSEYIGVKVDLLTEENISPYFKEDVKKQMIVLYN
jgi:predicted nucleotidyltransferase